MSVKLRSISLFALLIVAFVASAVPARPGLRTFIASDGSEIRVRLVGDEFSHIFFSEDGYPLIQSGELFNLCDIDADGKLIDSGIELTSPLSKRALDFISNLNLQVAHSSLSHRAFRNRAARSIKSRTKSISFSSESSESDIDAPPFEKGYGLFPGVSFPAYGEQKSMVILVQYADVKFTHPDAAGYFSGMLNEDGFSEYGATGCAAEYFRLNSNGAFRPEFDLYGPITLSHPRSYYGANDSEGFDLHPEEMVIEACRQLDDIVDFNDYDRNHDGIIDNIFIFYAGQGENSYGSKDTVWPHSWNVSEVSENYFDGLLLDSYGCTNEWNLNRPDGVGTFIHEFSHVIGLPDIYSTNYTGAFTAGAWSALDHGSYNNNGMTPPLYGAFERYALGWCEPKLLAGPESVSLSPVSDNVVAIIPTERENEFFLLENRQQQGWDAFIPGHGMLVWHVDYDEDIWRENIVNDNKRHQYVDIVEADNSPTAGSRSGDTFPGSAFVTSFTPSTLPALKSWSGTSVDVPLTNIREEGKMVSFDVCGGASALDPDPGLDSYVDSVGLGSFRIIGRDIFASVDTDEIVVHDISGRCVARNAGHLSIPAPGLYIISVASNLPLKILIN